MTIYSKKLLTSVLGITLVSSAALSDNILATCQSCAQIPHQKIMCVAGNIPIEVTHCGAEKWLHEGRVECKEFETFTVTCIDGSITRYTDERWYGAGSNCDTVGFEGNHHCY